MPSGGAPRPCNRSPQQRIEAAAAQRPEHIGDKDENGERQGGAEREEGDVDALGILKHEDDERGDKHHHDRQINPTHRKYLLLPTSGRPRIAAQPRTAVQPSGFLLQATWRRPMPSPIQLAPAKTRSTPRKIPSVQSEETGQWTRMMMPSNNVIRPETTTQIQGDPCCILNPRKIRTIPEATSAAPRMSVSHTAVNSGLSKATNPAMM